MHEMVFQPIVACYRETYYWDWEYHGLVNQDWYTTCIHGYCTCMYIGTSASVALLWHTGTGLVIEILSVVAAATPGTALDVDAFSFSPVGFETKCFERLIVFGRLVCQLVSFVLPVLVISPK